MPNKLKKVSELIQNKKYRRASEEAKKFIDDPKLGSSALSMYTTSLRQAKMFKELVECYSDIWKSKKIVFSDWDYKHFAYSLRKTKKYDEAVDICEIVKKRSPDFKAIIGDYYWSIYHRDIKKWYINQVEEDIILPFAKEIKEQFENDKNRQFTPYNSTILYIAEFYNSIEKYEKCIDWLSNIQPHEISKNGKFEKNGQIIFFMPQRGKYYSFLSNAFIKLEKYEKAKPILIQALYEFPFWQKLSESLLFVAENEFGERGVSVFDKMLQQIGFKESTTKNNYLAVLIGAKRLFADNWKNDFEQQEDYEKKYQTIMLAKSIKRLYNEIATKKLEYVSRPINYSMVSSSEVGSFVFCPASYSIQKSFEVKQDPESQIELIWEEKKLLIDRFLQYQKNGELNKAFSDEEKERIGEVPNIFKYILTSKILQESKKNKKPKIFFNKNKTFSGVPDYWLLNQNKFVVEEVFTRYSDKSEDLENPYPNHKAEIISQMIELKDLDAKEGYVIYWLWGFEKVEYDTHTTTEYKLKGIKVFKVEKNEKNTKNYDNQIKMIRKFNQEKEMVFNVGRLNPNKCVNCGVSQFCYHKIGKINKLTLPYNKE